jgi:hypothetical protein
MHDRTVWRHDMHGQTDEAMACMNLKILDPDGPTRQEEEEEKKTPKKKSPKSSPASPAARGWR